MDNNNQDRDPIGSPSEALVTRILESTLAVITENGLDPFTMNRVIARCGVDPSHVNPQWVNIGTLVGDTLRRLGPKPQVINTGALHSDLLYFVRYLAELFSSDKFALSHTSSAKNPGLRPLVTQYFVVPRRQMLIDILNNAMRRGEIKALPNIDDCWSLVSGPIYHRVAVRLSPSTRHFEQEMANWLYHALINCIDHDR